MNLSELERRTGISRAKLRRFKKDGFKSVNRSKKKRKSILDGYIYVTFLPIPQECLRDFLFWCSFYGLIHFLAVIEKNYLYLYREV